MSTVARAARGTFQPPAWSARIAPSTWSRPAASVWRSTPPDPTRTLTSASGRADSVGWAGRACRRTATRAASRASSRSWRALDVVDRGASRGARGRGRHTPSGPRGRRPCRGGARRAAASTTCSAFQRRPRSPSTVRACQSGATTSLRSVGVLALGRQARVDVGRRAADVDDEHVTARHRGEHLDAAQHDVGRRRLDHRREGRVARQALAADDVAQEGVADRGPRRLRRDDADLREDVVGQDGRAAGRSRGPLRPRRARRRCRRRRPARRARRGHRWRPWRGGRRCAAGRSGCRRRCPRRAG